MSADVPTLTVVASWCNHPELIKLHKELWCRAFPGETVRYVAYIDGAQPVEGKQSENTNSFQIWKLCQEANIQCVLVPEQFHQKRALLFPQTKYYSSSAPSFRNAVVCQYAWMKETSGGTRHLIFTQSDIFPFREQTCDAFMGGDRIFSYRHQHRVSDDGEAILEYAWEGLCGFDLSKWSPTMIAAMSFEAGFCVGVNKDSSSLLPPKFIFGDTGAGSSLVLRAIPAHLKREWTEHGSGRWSHTDDDLPPLPDWLQRFIRLDPRGAGAGLPSYSEIFDDWCFHLRGGSDYEKADTSMLQLRFSLFQAFVYEAWKNDTLVLSNLKQTEIPTPEDDGQG